MMSSQNASLVRPGGPGGLGGLGGLGRLSSLGRFPAKKAVLFQTPAQDERLFSTASRPFDESDFRRFQPGEAPRDALQPQEGPDGRRLGTQA